MSSLESALAQFNKSLHLVYLQQGVSNQAAAKHLHAPWKLSEAGAYEYLHKSRFSNQRSATSTHALQRLADYFAALGVGRAEAELLFEPVAQSASLELPMSDVKPLVPRRYTEFAYITDSQLVKELKDTSEDRFRAARIETGLSLCLLSRYFAQIWTMDRQSSSQFIQGLEGKKSGDRARLLLESHMYLHTAPGSNESNLDRRTRLEVFEVRSADYAAALDIDPHQALREIKLIQPRFKQVQSQVTPIKE